MLILDSPQGSRLGRVTTSRGHETRRVGDGRYIVEWEISEWNESDPEPSPGKRKLGEVAEGDVQMEH